MVKPGKAQNQELLMLLYLILRECDALLLKIRVIRYALYEWEISKNEYDCANTGNNEH